MRGLLIIALLVSQVTLGQTILLMHDTHDDKDGDFGPGKESYAGRILTSGWIVGPGETDSLSSVGGNSFTLGFGSFSRKQFNRFLGAGIQFDLGFKQYRISQDGPKVFATAQTHTWEKLWMINSQLTPFLRLSFSKRGDHHGIYVDLGGYGGYNFITRHSYRNTLVGSPAAESVKVVNRKLQYMNRYEYGGMFRLGIKNFLFFGKYRLSNHFKEFNGYTYPEPSRIVVGLSVSA